MPEILPTPRAGHWLKVDLHDGSPPVPPRAGHWLKLSPVPVPNPQPRAGHWLKLSPVPTPIGSHRMVMTAGMAPR